MQDDQGRALEEAGPCAAVEITGLEGVPEAGDSVHAVDSADKAREIASVTVDGRVPARVEVYDERRDALRRIGKGEPFAVSPWDAMALMLE